MNFDISLDTIVQVWSFGLSGCALVYSFITSRRKDVDERINHVEEAIGKARQETDHRLSALEYQMRNMPVKDDMHNLQLELVTMSGTLKEMNATMEGNAKIMNRLENIVSRHEDHLFEERRSS